MIHKTCKKHGELYMDDLIKEGFNSKGQQNYRCKKCSKERRDNHYKKNRDKIMEKQRQYRTNNLRYRLIHKDRLNEIHSKRKKMYLKTLHDVYIKKCMIGKSRLRSKDIPQALVEIKRIVIQIKRKIKEI
jgi:hypothetical protein